jgi:hypothetical protein
LARKEKALAETAALLVLRKKAAAIPLCQGSCPLLYFSSNCQAGGIGR